MTRRRDIALAALLALVLVTVALIAVWMRGTGPLPAYSAVSTQPRGAGALAEWLVALGYDVATDPASRFEPPKADEVLVVLEPIQVFTDQEWLTLEQSLKAIGGRVLIVGDGLTADLVMGHFGYSLGTTKQPVEAALPVFAAPVFEGAEVEVATLIGQRPGAAPLLVAGGEPAAVEFALGKGSVTLSTTIAAFSNKGLRDPDQARLVLNLVTATRPARVRFDEWHLGRRAAIAEPDTVVLGPEAWLLRTPTGQAVLFCLVLLLIALWLRGRPFGRPMPPAAELARRTPLEHVDALARLARRAGHRRAAADDYRQRLKRSIGQRYRIDPDLPDDGFLARLRVVAPGAANDELERLLKRLSETHDEAELVRLANSVARRLTEEVRHP